MFQRSFKFYNTMPFHTATSFTLKFFLSKSSFRLCAFSPIFSGDLLSAEPMIFFSFKIHLSLKFGNDTNSSFHTATSFTLIFFLSKSSFRLCAFSPIFKGGLLSAEPMIFFRASLAANSSAILIVSPGAEIGIKYQLSLCMSNLGSDQV